MARIFISHSSKDKSFVYELRNWLGKKGHKAWVDQYDLLVGEEVQQKIKEYIERCDAVLFVLTPDALDSKWFQEELSIAREKKRLLPLLLKDCGQRFPVALEKIKHADFRTDQQRGWEELSQALSPWDPPSARPEEKPSSRDQSVKGSKTSEARPPARTGSASPSPVRIMAALLLVAAGLGLTQVSNEPSTRASTPPGNRRKSLLLEAVESIQSPAAPGFKDPSTALPMATPVKTGRIKASGDSARSLTELRGQDKVRPLQDNETNLSVDHLPMGSFGFVELNSLRFLRNAQTSLTNSVTSFEVHKTPEGELFLVGYTSELAFSGTSRSRSLSLSLTPKQTAWATKIIRIPLSRIRGISTRFDQGEAIADLNLGAALSER